MLKNLVYLLLATILTACSHTYYVVRHAEKAVNPDAATMASDPPLTEGGQTRAEALKDLLKYRDIRFIFSTNTNRTKSIAEPLRFLLGLTTRIYCSRPDSAFIQRLKQIKKNMLVIAQSITVDDIVNS